MEKLFTGLSDHARSGGSFASPEISKNALVPNFATYMKPHKESVRSPEKFLSRKAATLAWSKKWSRVLDWNAPFAKGFMGGRL